MVLLDANNLAYIAYYSLGELSEGEVRTGTVFGFLNIVNQIASRFGTSLIFCFDSKKNLRKKADKEYKANRHKDMTPEDAVELRAMQDQITQLRKEVLPQMGFRNIRVKSGYEADDIIAYFAKKYTSENITIVSTDKDLYQLLTKNVSVYNPKTKKMYTRNNFVDNYGIKPNKWALVKAIGGDSSDNIKGIWKVGEKTAIKYVTGQLKTTSKAYENIKLNWSVVKKNLSLTSLPYKEVDFGFRHRKNKLTREKFIKVFDRLRFIYYLREEQFERWEKNFELKKKKKLKRVQGRVI